MDDAPLLDESIALVEEWLARAHAGETRVDRRGAQRLRGVVADDDGLAFSMRFVDRVVRPEDNRVAAHQLRGLVVNQPLPAFLSPVDRVLLRAGARLAPILPTIVMPLALRRMRSLVGHLVVDAAPEAVESYLAKGRAEGFRLNVNLLGEAVLGEAEAARRHAALLALLDQPEVDYVSVKVSAIVAQLNPWAFDDSLARVVERLRPLFERSAATDPPTFVNLDMEEYHDLELTVAAFTALLDEPALHGVDAGIVLQAYLPDSFAALQHLVTWAHERHRRTVDGVAGGRIKIRLVKGANLAMERVEAAIRGWPQAPYETKADTDANYKRCVDWVLTPERTRAVKVGLASHNLFDVAWAHLLSADRGVADRLEVEMLQGMAPSAARVVRDAADGLLLYTPVVAPTDFDVAISYLFRRLEENASEDNFLHHLFALEPGSLALRAEADRFARAVQDRHSVPSTPRRTQDRTRPPPAAAATFHNEPDTDPALAANRAWAAELVDRAAEAPRRAVLTSTDAVDAEVAAAREAHPAWAGAGAETRREVLWAVAEELARRRGDLVAAMVQEGRKTVAEADPEVSEAVDFARWYGDRALELVSPAARFEPLGVVAVVPPWNFPVAIPAGGVFAALAAGNAALLKPAPETPRCAEIVAECAWTAGVPEGALRFVPTPDDEVGRHLVTHPDVGAVILTGGHETAQLFRSWRPDLAIFGETSGKNALVITPHADLDLAVDDLVRSAFGHSGQKCSAASLAICVGDVYRSERFRRQLIDAVESLAVGPPTDLATSMGPIIRAPEAKLTRGLTELDRGESWLVPPRRLDDATWTPGVRDGVRPDSWFHRTECFGPVLGLMAARTLDQAIAFQNGTDYGLTGGIHSLDPAEVDRWLARVEVGNAYVNRVTTGAVVRRQPFGGWKRSSIGPGAKAGGPNYVRQLGRWTPTDLGLPDDEWLARAAASDATWWADEFSLERDDTGLFCEANAFRYRPLDTAVVRVGAGAAPREVERVVAAARRCGAAASVSRAAEQPVAAFVAELLDSGAVRVRVLGPIEDELREAAAAHDIHLAAEPVTTDGRIELLHHLREQAISRTLHRYGNLV